ncbi:MAG: hypothetical protein AAGA85_23350 [Bacteroidota bacterium]
MLTEALSIPSTISEVELIFRGDPESPFLAPRGVWLHNGILVVADTGQNRVFIWKQLPRSEVQSPDIVLGQESVQETGRNAGQAVGPDSLQYPSGVWTDGEKLIVADAWNHRVLIWHTFPSQNGTPADVVLGQKDFLGNEPNAEGVGAGCNERTLYWPYGVHCDGERLFIADTGNRRVMYYNSIPTSSFSAADGVIGKEDFVTRDYEPQQPIWPYSIRISERGALAITDTQFFRVLLWKDWRSAEAGASPDQIVGQPDLVANGQNQYGLSPGPNSLNWCYDSFFHKDGILVADTANSRIKWHDSLFSANNPAASDLLGQPNFTTGSENVANLECTSKTLYWPFSICSNAGRLAIADTGNHRVIINKITI